MIKGFCFHLVEKQSLISKVDCEESPVTLEEADKFLCKEQAVAKIDTSKAQDSAEDLVSFSLTF